MCTRLLSQVFFPFGERVFQCVVEFQVIRVTRSQFTAKPFRYNVFPSRTYRVAMTTAKRRWRRRQRQRDRLAYTYRYCEYCDWKNSKRK